MQVEVATALRTLVDGMQTNRAEVQKLAVTNATMTMANSRLASRMAHM